MNDFSGFVKIMKEFIELFDELIPVEQAKLDAAVKNRPTFVEDCMNKEQAAILRMRGLEQKREAEQKKLGLEGLTFRQILEQVPDETAHFLKPLFDTLSERVTTFRSTSGSAKEAIEINLHMIQSAIASRQAGPNTYTPAGTVRKSGGNTTHFTSRSV